MVAIDQGERLAALAATHCVPYPQVRVVACAFEAWQARYARTKQIAVFAEIRRVISEMGGEVIRNYETLALLAKKG